MAAKRYVFISYARNDTNVVREIVEALQSAGIGVWMDVKDIAPGVNFAEEIRHAINNAAAFVFFASRHSAISKFMELELMAALSGKRNEVPIIPVILDDVGCAELPAFLKERQWVDLRGGVSKGIANLVAFLAKRLPQAKPIANRKAKNKGYAFFSYSMSDRRFLDELKTFLGKHDYGYWDFHENKRDYQTQFHLELEGVIRDSQAVLCILTPDWKRSRWAPREFLFSEEINKPVFLLKYRALEPTLLIAGSSFINFVSDRSKGYAELDRELRARGF